MLIEQDMIGIEKIKYIEDNTTFRVNSIVKYMADITCTRCDFNKLVAFSSIKRSKDYKCNNCEDLEKTKYVEQHTTFKVNSINNSFNM